MSMHLPIEVKQIILVFPQVFYIEPITIRLSSVCTILGVGGLISVNGVATLYRFALDPTMDRYFQDVTHCTIVVTMETTFNLKDEKIIYQKNKIITPTLSSNDRLHVQFGYRGIQKCIRKKNDMNTRLFSSPTLVITVSMHLEYAIK